MVMLVSLLTLHACILFKKNLPDRTVDVLDPV